MTSYAIQAGALRTNPNSGPDGVGVQADIAYTLEARAEVQAVMPSPAASATTTRGETMIHANDNSQGPPLRFLSVCSGIEAASVAWPDWTPVAFSEIEKFPSAVLKHHYPDVPNLGDFTKIDTTTLGRVDILCGGTPCFTAGHMVLSAKGYVPIEDIKVGDEVVTHKGRLRTVVRIGNERKEVGVLTGVGMCEPITCTADHPFLSVEWRNQNTRRNNLYTQVEHCGHPEWVAAKEMPGRQWCQLLSHDNDNRAPESAKFDVKTAMYIAGMYLGDGWIRKHEGKAKKSVVLGINPEKYVKLKAAIGNAVHTVSRERTIVRVSIHDTAFADWLEAEFAHYSHLKTVPSWVMGHSFRGEFLRGFLDTDGSVTKDGKVSISTTSRSVAYGISDLMAAEGYVSSVALVETPDTCVIEGRTCNQRDYYQVRAYPQPMSRKSRVRHGMMLRTVSGFTPVGEETVFNIEVDEDHSYVVQSAVVHNCQAFSVAGLRKGLDDERGNLTLKFVELAHELAGLGNTDGNGLRNVVWENVVGVLSDKGNAFGCFLAGLVGADAPIVPPGKWTNAGMVSGPLGRAAWRVLDAQYFGVAQRRRRVIVVADFGNGADPAAVLLIEQGLPRNPPARGEAGKDVAHTISARTKGGGGLGTDFDLDGGMVESAVAYGGNRTSGPIDVSPALAAHPGPHGRQNFESEAFLVQPVIHATEIARCDATREGSSQDYETTTMVAVAGTLCKDSFIGGMGGRPEGAASGHVVAVASIHADSIGRTGEAVTPSADAAGVVRLRNPGMGVIDDGTTYNLMASGHPHAVCVTGDISHTLKAEGADASEDGTGRGTPIVALAFAENSRAELRLEGGDGQTVGTIGVGGGKPGQGYPAICFSAKDYDADAAYDIAPTLRSGNHDGSHANGGVMPAVAYGLSNQPTPKFGEEISPSLDAKQNGGGRMEAVAYGSAVRRLTPVECERLQGFPDNYTAIPWRGKPAEECPDGPRYKALGNSWAVPKFVWLGKRIAKFMPVTAVAATTTGADNDNYPSTSPITTPTAAKRSHA